MHASHLRGRELYLVAAVAGTESARLFPAAGRPSTRAARQRACAVSPWPLTKHAFVFAALPPPWTGPANSGAAASCSGLVPGAGALPHPGTHPPGASLAAALTRTTESPTGAHARSGPHVFDPTDRRDARGGRYLKYRPPPVGPSTLFVARRPPPAPLLAGALRRPGS